MREVISRLGRVIANSKKMEQRKNSYVGSQNVSDDCGLYSSFVFCVYAIFYD